ncbi:4Fe-4S binding protein [Thiovibrio sp. JS02]
MKELTSRKITQWLLAPLVPIVIVGGQFFPYLGFLPIVLLAVMVVLVMFRGRFYCGWICAMGAFHERILALVSRKKKMLPLFQAAWFRRLLFVLMMGLLFFRLLLSGGDPEKVGASFVMMWTISTLFAMGLGLYWKPRSWCSLCPMATFQGLFSSCNYVLRVASSCKQCGICQKVCPIETNPGAYKNQGFVESARCMRCANCVQNCPQKALAFASAPQGHCSPLGNLGLGPKAIR